MAEGVSTQGESSALYRIVGLSLSSLLQSMGEHFLQIVYHYMSEMLAKDTGFLLAINTNHVKSPPSFHSFDNFTAKGRQVFRFA